MITIGIDPGLSGAIAWLDGTSLLYATDLPVLDGRIDAGTLVDLINEYPLPNTVVIEKVSSMPGQGVVSTFKFGQSYGTLLGVFGALKYGMIDVTPRRWKRDLSLSSDKEQARQLAINTWPDLSDLFKRKKDHGRAEAALIASWYLNYYE